MRPPEPRIPNPDWLTIKDVARRLSVSPKMVRKWMHAGQFDEIVAFNERVIRISLASYHRFIQKRRAA